MSSKQKSKCKFIKDKCVSIVNEPEIKLLDISDISFKKSSSKLYLGAFQTKVEDIIKFSSSKYRQSTANLKTYGFEIRYKTIFYDFLSTNFNYTKTHGKENDGDSITLVPKDKIVLSLNVDLSLIE